MSFWNRLIAFRKGSNLSRLVAERLRGEDIRAQFVNRVVRSMKEYPHEWEVLEGKATHRSGIIVDVTTPQYKDPGIVFDKLEGRITKPSFVLLSPTEAETLGDAFDYLTKLKVLESLHMDKV